jgi:hypothetical protein
MRYFIISVLLLLVAVGIHRIVLHSTPDRSRESGLRRVEQENPPVKQSQEEKTSFDIQREGRNVPPRK